MISGTGLAGAKVFVIEDEPLICMLLEDMLSDMGCETVAIATGLAEAVMKVAEVECDVVIMDVNLSGEQTFKLAESLGDRRLPFVFSTGYGQAGIPPNLQHVPVLQKPFHDWELKQALSVALASRQSPQPLPSL